MVIGACGCCNNEDLSYHQESIPELSESSEIVTNPTPPQKTTPNATPNATPSPTPTPEPTPTVTPEPVKEVITFRISAYCACEYCCGEYALGRPTDDNGNPIVYGASGNALVSGVSCASPLPFGTTIELYGYGTVSVEDRTADWIVDEYGYYILDLYFDDHQTACEWGVKFIDGVIM